MKYAHATVATVLTVGLTVALLAPASGQGVTEHGIKQADGLEVTLLSAPPLSPDEIQRMMPGMRGMKGMGGMMSGMPGMEGMGGTEAQPTHWIGVIVRDLKDDRVVPGLRVTLTARKGELTRAVTLMPMRASYGANIALPEKGWYTATVTIARPGQPLSVPFELDNK